MTLRQRRDPLEPGKQKLKHHSSETDGKIEPPPVQQTKAPYSSYLRPRNAMLYARGLGHHRYIARVNCSSHPAPPVVDVQQGYELITTIASQATVRSAKVSVQILLAHSKKSTRSFL